jgi:hypothetical protein
LYRALAGEAVSGSFDERFRMADGDWGDPPRPDDAAPEPDDQRRRANGDAGRMGGSWQPDPAKLDQALREASREDAERSAAAIAGAAFPPGPGDAVLGKPDSGYYLMVGDLIERTRTQRWVAGLARWTVWMDASRFP